MIKAIICDNEGVLSFTKAGSFSKLWADRLETQESKIKDIWSSPESEKLQLGWMTKEAFFRYTVESLGINQEKIPLLETKIDDLYYDQTMLDFIKQQKKYLKTCLLSVMPLYLQELIREHWREFEYPFDQVIISSEVHLLKTDIRIYHLALKRLGCQPHETLFIDDQIMNIETAESIGIKGIHFHNRTQALSEITQLLRSGTQENS